MIERDWACELEQHLQRRFAEWCQTIGQSVPVRGFALARRSERKESQYFLLGLEAGFFLVDEEGYVQSELFPPLEDGEQRTKDMSDFLAQPLSASFIAKAFVS